MKKFYNSGFIGFLILIFLWLFPATITDGYGIKTLIFNGVFLLSVCAAYFINNEAARMIVVIGLTSAASICDFSYLLYILPIFILLCSYVNILKSISTKRERNKSNSKQNDEIGLTISSVWFVLAAIYTLIDFDNLKLSDFVVSSDTFKTAFILILFFIVLLILSVSPGIIKALQINKKDLGSLRFVYLIAVVGIIEITFVYLNDYGYHSSPFERGWLIYWFILLTVSVYCEDPFVKYAVDKIKEKVKIDKQVG